MELKISLTKKHLVIFSAVIAISLALHLVIASWDLNDALIPNPGHEAKDLAISSNVCPPGTIQSPPGTQISKLDDCIQQINTGLSAPNAYLCGDSSNTPACDGAESAGGTGNSNYRAVSCVMTGEAGVMVRAHALRYTSGRWQVYASGWGFCIDGTVMVLKIQ